MDKEEIMSNEAFKELMENLEVVEKLTPYGRKAIKYWVTKLLKGNKEKDKQIIELNKYLERISQDLDNVAIDQIPIAIAELKYQNKLKNKQIHIMARAFRQDDVRNVEEIKEYFEKQAKEKGEKYEENNSNN